MPSKDRILPCLLDRLSDDEPHKRVETASERSFTLKRFRQAILRDLRWLMNARNQQTDSSFMEYEEVRTSVLNFGVKDLCGNTFATLDIPKTENEIRQSILHFEPRIIPQTLQVRVIQETVRRTHAMFGVEISGQFYADPVPEQLLVRSMVDLETGVIDIKE